MNQKKSTKILLILIIILIVILIAGVAFAYFATDLFKSNKELFFKYITQMASSEEGFIDNELKQYFEKRKTNPYTDEGNFLVNITSEENQAKLENTNNFNITFSGQVDTTNSKTAQDISLNYSDTVNFPISYKQIENTIGLQTKYVGSRFIAVKTDELDKLFVDTSNETDSIGEITSSISKVEEVAENSLTDEEKSHLQTTYIGILDENLDKDKFSKVQEQNSNGYKIALTGEELKELLVKLLETLKNDQTTLDKINDYLKIQKNSAKITASDIDEEIESINNDTSLNEETFEITVYTSQGKTNKLTITTKEEKINLEKIKENNQLKLSLSYEKETEDATTKIAFIANYEGLETLQNVKESYELELQYETENSGQNTYVYQLNNNVKFVENIQVEDFTEDNSIILTDYEQENVSNFMNTVIERIKLVNQKQMEELGLEENENPIQYIIPQFEIYQNASNIINQSRLTEAEINTFNQKFEMYESTNLKGVTVKGLLSTIALNNESQDDDRQIKEINFNGEEYDASEQNITFIKEDVDTEKSYRVEFEKDQDTGMIYRAVINEK